MNDVYRERAALAVALVRVALDAGCRAGIRGHEPEDAEWDTDYQTVLLIDLPTGQVSWHLHVSDLDLVHGLPAYSGNWDGHSTIEKIARLQAFRGFHG